MYLNKVVESRHHFPTELTEHDSDSRPTLAITHFSQTSLKPGTDQRALKVTHRPLCYILT